MQNDLQKLKTSLCDVINQWMSDQNDSEGWNQLDILVGDLTGELMADSAFNILLAQQTHDLYLWENDMMKAPE